MGGVCMYASFRDRHGAYVRVVVQSYGLLRLLLVVFVSGDCRGWAGASRRGFAVSASERAWPFHRRAFYYLCLPVDDALSLF